MSTRTSSHPTCYEIQFICGISIRQDFVDRQVIFSSVCSKDYEPVKSEQNNGIYTYSVEQAKPYFVAPSRRTSGRDETHISENQVWRVLFVRTKLESDFKTSAGSSPGPSLLMHSETSLQKAQPFRAESCRACNVARDLSQRLFFFCPKDLPIHAHTEHPTAGIHQKSVCTHCTTGKSRGCLQPLVGISDPAIRPQFSFRPNCQSNHSRRGSQL